MYRIGFKKRKLLKLDKAKQTNQMKKTAIVEYDGKRFRYILQNL